MAGPFAEAQHHLGIDEVLGAAEGDHSDFHRDLSLLTPNFQNPTPTPHALGLGIGNWELGFDAYGYKR